jgi:hypothetical protein
MNPKLKEKAQGQAHSQAKAKPEKETKHGGIKKKEKMAKGWLGAHIQLFQSEDMLNAILLDNQSTVTIFCNARMVNDIREMQDSLHLATNGGVLVSKYKATVPDWGEVRFNPKAMTNIFCFAEMAQRHKALYAHKDDSFIMHLSHKDVKFNKAGAGLYVFRPNLSKGDKSDMQFVTTLSENKTFYTDKQFERAKQARELYHAVDMPSIKDFKAIIIMNAIKINPVTIEDVDLAEQIFGPDIGSLKGKTARQKPALVIHDNIEIPNELVEAQREVTLCMDAMNVNGL